MSPNILFFDRSRSSLAMDSSRDCCSQGRCHMARLCEAHPYTQHLGHAPRLRDAATRRIRRLGVENLADRADTRLVEMHDKAVHRAACSLAIVRKDSQPRVDERSYEPRPDGTLVVRRVAGAKIAEIPRLEIPILRRERTQADGRQQPIARRLHD